MDDFNQDINIGNAASDRQQNIVVVESSVRQDFTVKYNGSNLTTNKNLVNVETLERCFNERIDKEMGDIVDTVEDRIQNAILTAIASSITPSIELTVRVVNGSSGRDANNVTANSKRRGRILSTASFESVSEKNNTLHVSNTNDETRKNIPDEISELLVPGILFD